MPNATFQVVTMNYPTRPSQFYGVDTVPTLPAQARKPGIRVRNALRGAELGGVEPGLQHEQFSIGYCSNGNH